MPGESVTGDAEVVHYADRIKQIAPSVLLPSDPATFDRSVYPVGPESRLLLSYRKLQDDRAEIEEAMRWAPVQFVLTAPRTLTQAERDGVLLCPMTRRWTSE